jgi:hypothetical protein
MYSLSMPKYMKNLLTLAGVIIIGSFLVFLHDCIVGLAGFAGRLNPALEPWVYWVLFLLVAVSMGWAAAVAFIRPKPLLVYADPTEDDLAEFRRLLTQRLKRNKTLREAGVRVVGQDDLEPALAVLKERADAEIRATARQVFISTALAQNGRLDSLVVLFLISRLAWRISRLYNQRPRSRELINLYANIAATSFLAGSIEEFGVDEYVRELMGPLVGGSAIGAVPGAQAVAGVITSSVLSGSTNCLLALRCGIVARDYVSLSLDAKGAMRRSATLEASRIFVTMSAETVLYVTRVLVKGSTGAVRAGTARMVRGVGGAVSGTANAVGDGAKGVGRGLGAGAKSVGRGARNVAQTAVDAADTVAEAARQTVSKVTASARTAADRTADATRTARRGVTSGVKAVADGAGRVAGKGRDKARSLAGLFDRIRDRSGREGKKEE